jgi:hypothetical protein
MEWIASKIKNIPEDSYVRVMVKKGSALSLGEDVLQTRWPTLNWTVDHEKVKQRAIGIDLVVQEKTSEAIIINRDTVCTLVQIKLQETPTPAGAVEKALSMLKEFV